MTSSNCGFTVTGTRTRYECFLRQLKAYGLVVYNTLHTLFYVQTDTDSRPTITLRMNLPKSRQYFISELSTRCSDINGVILSALTPYIHLMGLGPRYQITDEVDYTPALWTFFTRVIYERPALLQPDSHEGDSVLYLQESFQWFLTEQVRPKKTEDTR
jgi:hypothetical protein